MADNILIPISGGTATIRSKDTGTAHVQSVGLADQTGAAVTTYNGRLSVAVGAVSGGGGTPFKIISAASTNATSVKGSAGVVSTIIASNTSTSNRFLKFYNKASAPTVGTDTPLWTVLIPAGGGLALNLQPGIGCTTGIGAAITVGAADNDTAAVGAGEVIVNLLYA